MYNAKVFRILIASPGDVQEERKVVVDAIYRWNQYYSESKQIVLLPVMWETHSAPELGDGPQNIINKQMVDSCDIVIGMFWTRLGSPTNNAVSGTVEEIERLGREGKLIMLFFSDKPISPSKIDKVQYENLERLKSTYYKRGLIQNFISMDELKSKIDQALIIHINDRILENINENSKESKIGEEEKTKSFSTGELLLIDSFPREGEIIKHEEVKKIFLKFNKPIDRKSVQYIGNYFVAENIFCQWNVCGWIEFAEENTKLIFHIKDEFLNNINYFTPLKGYHTFEIHIGREPDDWVLTAIDGSKMAQKIINVKISE